MSNAIRKILNNEELLEEVTKRSFDSVDTDKSGKIDLKELAVILKQIAVDFWTEAPTDEELAKVLEELDTDKSGTIELIEFKILIKNILEAMLNQDK